MEVLRSRLWTGAKSDWGDPPTHARHIFPAEPHGPDVMENPIGWRKRRFPLVGCSPLLLTGRPFLAALGHSASARSQLPSTEPVSGLRAFGEMLLLLLLFPVCWAVEVKRPRGVSLTSESAAGCGRKGVQGADFGSWGGRL